MATTTTTDDDEVAALAEEEDNTEEVLRTWGLAGSPISWAPQTWQPLVATIREANKGVLDATTVQAILDATFPDAGYVAANVALAHPIVGDFTATVTGASVRVDLAGDVDLLLPDEHVGWDFGDGSVPVYDAGGLDHEYGEDGDYTIRLSIAVAGSIYNSAQDVTTVTVPPVVADEEFDPADYTVDEVLAYAAEHPDEVDAIRVSEEQGKARVGVLDKL